jgi:hypothetical protein
MNKHEVFFVEQDESLKPHGVGPWRIVLGSSRREMDRIGTTARPMYLCVVTALNEARALASLLTSARIPIDRVRQVIEDGHRLP